MRLAPRVINSDISTAWQEATERVEPIWVPAPIYVDDRGWSIMNQLQGVLSAEGQVNLSVMFPQVVKAWHRHRLQTDFWICTRGHLKAGVHRQDDGRTWMAIMGELKSGVLIIPPTLWHGATVVGPESAGLFYYVSHAYNPTTPDEERRPYDSVPGFEWGTSHG